MFRKCFIFHVVLVCKYVRIAGVSPLSIHTNAQYVGLNVNKYRT